MIPSFCGASFSLQRRLQPTFRWVNPGINRFRAVTIGSGQPPNVIRTNCSRSFLVSA
jgi:hypothetical protein